MREINEPERTREDPNEIGLPGVPCCPYFDGTPIYILNLPQSPPGPKGRAATAETTKGPRGGVSVTNPPLRWDKPAGARGRSRCACSGLFLRRASRSCPRGHDRILFAHSRLTEYLELAMIGTGK